MFHKEFLEWRKNPVMDKADPFVNRIFREDITMCLDFSNKELLERVVRAVEDGSVLVESVGDKAKVIFPK